MNPFEGRIPVRLEVKADQYREAKKLGIKTMNELQRARLKALDIWLGEYSQSIEIIHKIVGEYNTGPNIGKDPNSLDQAGLALLYDVSNKIEHYKDKMIDAKKKIQTLVMDSSSDPVYDKLKE